MQYIGECRRIKECMLDSEDEDNRTMYLMWMLIERDSKVYKVSLIEFYYCNIGTRG